MIPIFWSRIGERVYRIGFFSQLLVFAVSVLALYDVSSNNPIHIDFLPNIIGGKMQFGLYINRLTAVMMVLVTAIGTIIHVFAARYLQRSGI